MSNYDYYAGSSRPVAPPAPMPTPPDPSMPSATGAGLQPAAFTPAATLGTHLSAEEQMMLQTSAVESYHNMHTTTGTMQVGMGLGFLGNIRVGFELISVCWGVLTQQLSMLLVPLAVMVLGAVVVLGYATALGGLADLADGGGVDTAIRLFPILVMLGSIGAVGQAVIVADATDLLNGTRTSLSKAWSTVANQLPRIVLFGVMYAAERTMTSILRASRRWSLFANLTADIADRAWDFTTYLAIPVLLYEETTVLGSVKRSGHLVTQRWGVQLTARWAIGYAMLLVALPFILLAVLAIGAGHAFIGFAVLIVACLVATVVSGALTGVLSAALYRFGTTGVIAPGFTPSDLTAVFSHR